MASNLDDLVRTLDNLDLSQLTVGDLRTVKNPVLADAIRKMIDLSMVPDIASAGHTSHSNHLSHFNHLSHGSSIAELPVTDSGTGQR